MKTGGGGDDEDCDFCCRFSSEELVSLISYRVRGNQVLRENKGAISFIKPAARLLVAL